jgi:hypothetical protein
LKTILILSDQTRSEVARVKAYAEANVIPLVELIRRMGTDNAVGDDPKRRVFIPPCRVVYSLETQIIGPTHHFSISLEDCAETGALPDASVVTFIMFLFGVGAILSERLDRAMIETVIGHAVPSATIITTYLEGISGKGRALNVIAKLD